jgi:uridine kinase
MRYDELAALLRPTGSTALLGIDGAGGSGKSTFARRLEGVDPQAVTLVEVDDFYRPTGNRADDGAPGEIPLGASVDWVRLREQVLAPLREGRGASYQRYDWDRDALAEWHHVDHGGVVVVEGVYSTRAELRSFYDFRIWIDAPRDVRLARGIARDGKQARARWEHEWMPAEDRYLDEHRSRDAAHLVVDGSDGGDPASFVVLVDRLRV